MRMTTSTLPIKEVGGPCTWPSRCCCIRLRWILLVVCFYLLKLTWCCAAVTGEAGRLVWRKHPEVRLGRFTGCAPCGYLPAHTHVMASLVALPEVLAHGGCLLRAELLQSRVHSRGGLYRLAVWLTSALGPPYGAFSPIS